MRKKSLKLSSFFCRKYVCFQVKFFANFRSLFSPKIVLKKTIFLGRILSKIACRNLCKTDKLKSKILQKLCSKIHNIEDKILKILKKSEQKIEYICLLNRTLHKIDKIQQKFTLDNAKVIKSRLFAVKLWKISTINEKIFRRKSTLL